MHSVEEAPLQLLDPMAIIQYCADHFIYSSAVAAGETHTHHSNQLTTRC